MSYPQQHQSYGNTPTPKPRRKHWMLRIVGGIAGLIVVIIVITAISNGGSSPSGPAVNVPAASAPATTVVPTTASGPATSVVDGTYVVGADIASGTWHTAGGGDGYCGWSRLKNTSGEFSAIIANGVASGPTTVTVKPTDNAFATLGGCTWTKE